MQSDGNKCCNLCSPSLPGALPSALDFPTTSFESPKPVTDSNVPQTAVLMFGAYISLVFQPAMSRDSYRPTSQPQFTDLAARTLGAWFMVCGLVRFATWWNWGDMDAGFRGWYDATMLTLASPLWHYGGEYWLFGTLARRHMIISYSIDGLGLVYMLWVRSDVLER